MAMICFFNVFKTWSRHGSIHLFLDLLNIKNRYDLLLMVEEPLKATLLRKALFMYKDVATICTASLSNFHIV